MREHLYKAKEIDTNKWVSGSLITVGDYCFILQNEEDLHPLDYPYIDELGRIDGSITPVIPETISEYTGYDEFTLVNGYGEKLFENDIVEAWAERHVYGRIQSQYDGKYKVRGVIKFKHGMFYIDYNNEYSNSLIKTLGDEKNDRHIGCYIRDFSDIECLTPERLQWYQEHNPHYTYKDIVKIGNIFDEKELIERRTNSEGV